MGESLLSPEEIAALVSKMNQETDESIDPSGDLLEEPSDQQHTIDNQQPTYAPPPQPSPIKEEGVLMTDDRRQTTETRKVVFSPFENKVVADGVRSVGGMEKFGHMHFPLKIVLGEIEMTIRELLDLRKDSVVILDTLTGEDASLLINDDFLAKGEIVALNDCFALRISALEPSDDKKEMQGEKLEEEEIKNK